MIPTCSWLERKLARAPIAAVRRERTISAVLAMSFVTIVARAQAPCFENAASTPAGLQSAGIASGDLDDDGDADLASITSNGVELLINQGSGTFASPVVLGAGARAPRTADLDGDGDLDIAHLGNNAIVVRFSLGAGSFAPPISLPIGIQVQSLVATDFDADGDVDLAATGSGFSSTIAVVLNTGGGTFAPAVAYAANSGTTALAAGDIDGDGDVDLLASLSTAAASFLANQGNGTFVRLNPILIGSITAVLALGDLDADGDIDIVASDTWNEWISVTRNNGGGVFSAPVMYIWGSMPGSVALGDLDGDGDLDIVAGYLNEFFVSIGRNLGNGTFAPHIRHFAGTFPEWCVLDDFDGDGDLDIAADNWGGGLVWVLRGCRVSGASACAGDASGTLCPCANDEAPGVRAGCRNSLGVGARIAGAGSTRVSLDGLVLSADQMPANATAVFFQGTQLENGGAGLLFDDGLACAGGTLVRIGTKANAGGSSRYPGPGDPSVSVRGAVTTAGERVYQVRYRNSAAFCTPSTSNGTNALRIRWSP